MPDNQTIAPMSGGLDAALRRAREMEAAHLEAVLAVRDAELLRLEALKAELAPAVAAHDRARDFFDLAIVPGEPPRLWIDLISSVIMAPDPRTYRLTQELLSGRAVLLETADRAEMTEKIKAYMAHRLVARDREIAGARPVSELKTGYSLAAMIMVWLLGLAGGALALCIADIMLKKLDF